MSRFGAKRGKKLPGAEFTWDNEPGGEPDTAPTPLFPKYTPPHAKPLTDVERRQVDYYRQLREKIHDGPYYAVLDGPPSYGKGQTTSARARFDPFQGMATYGQRYLKKNRTLPKLSGRPYVMNFFPKDLWSTLDPNYVGLPTGGANGFSSLIKIGQKRGFEEDEDAEEAEKMRKRPHIAEGDDEGSDAEKEKGRGDEEYLDEEENDGEEEIVDDDFEDDEEDMGGDYNAEQYFDGGDEEGENDGGGGEDNDTF
ncbi:hypothetical protein AJ80_03602 [Polytolypa hystricis UAMH7299]|uniref:DNA-directed RNA polymerase III subunit n=1 Tax=Polytolypa hystricis (strain UAMH7299) TaxID=1447883 RepID=A0A2B7Y8D4_POLH7|nr:hypothetical protein AJ80_03602 [Polytolypa hystricis UAMH7299]